MSNYTQQQALTVVVPFDRSKVAQIQSALQAIQDRVEDSPEMPFREMHTLHFARWFVMDNLTDTIYKPVQPMLGFATDFDGDLDTHLKQLCELGAEGLDNIYQYCEGYPEKSKRTVQSRVAFLKKYFLKPRLFWGSKFGYSAEQIKKEGELRDAIRDFIEEQAPTAQWPSQSPQEIRKTIVQYVQSQPDLQWAMQEVNGPSFGWKVKYWGKIIIILLIALLLLFPVIIPFLIFWILVGRHYEKVDDRKRKEHPAPVPPDSRYEDLVKIEDRIFQNQLTVYGTIKKPYWFKRTTLKLALHIFALNGAYRSTKGKLSGIPTIHFARWVIFNDDKNVMFLSNYNGNWENYLSEFIERSADAMNVSFGTMVGYPKVKWFIKEGAHDEQKFKALVRSNQYPSQVYYSAYPNLSVRNILNNAVIRKGLYEDLSPAEVKDWVQRLY